MARSQSTIADTIPIGERAALCVEEFAALHGFSRSHAYQLLRDGVGPRTFKAGARRLISQDAIAAWVKAREKVEARA